MLRWTPLYHDQSLCHLLASPKARENPSLDTYVFCLISLCYVSILALMETVLTLTFEQRVNLAHMPCPLVSRTLATRAQAKHKFRVPVYCYVESTTDAWLIQEV